MDQKTKASLKQDHFIETTSHGLQWAGQNRRSVATTAILLLAAILLVVGGIALYSLRSGQASVAFGAAMQDYQTPLVQPGQPVPPGVKTYPSALERARSANAKFQAVADHYGMTPDGHVALYFAGLTEIEANQTATAEATLGKVADGWDGNLAALAKLSLAQLDHQTGQDAKAIELYNQLNAKPTSTVPAGLAQLQLAEMYDSEGKTAEAKAIYAQLKDKDAKGAIGQIAAQKLNPAPAGAGAGGVQAE